MMNLKLNAGVVAGAVFDRLAPTYDVDFTDSLIGRAQRNAVWKEMEQTFHSRDNILELNCGTGEDAFFLAGHGISVFACDASEQMIARAEQRLRQQSTPLPVVFCHLATERLAELAPELQFDGVFSNFSGLNCTENLAAVASSLADLVKQRGSLLLCTSTRCCLMEMIYYLIRREPSKAFRRLKGYTQASLAGATLTVYYPTVREMRNAFRPHFQLKSVMGVGVCIPPSYLESWARHNSRTFDLLCRAETYFANLPFLRASGDHVLLRFEKVSA